ncbi:short chain oxidoreductase (CsgA), putative [Talaromyces stipitatus ATCC 10500]|uniref:Short chain oxidoreductase (CsgA), putative n=1 Tax=Talaromyces stipitatus (strain ATCC 10500 / CBS 375.48 / QM 6759 / NRRL 1006) TaxID=441959 RepID=B8ML51_TALSN|nr:short chain oxidoreductase (CsgA), putative [Talaromyces stipitatus ATCC 10500]EED15467.1 short chain oxidoreductase (CsgA), putative [Talaromyces stipitatus ATCC 10500]
MASVLITGTSRGLGLALVEHILTLPSTIIGTIYATTRASSAPEALSELINSSNGRVHHVQLDVTDASSVAAAVHNVNQLSSGRGIDILINNAGRLGENSGKASAMTAADLETTFATNVMGVHRVTAAFLPLLREENSSSVPCTAYKISKAALSMLTVQYAAELASERFTVFEISPGWLQTDLGGEHAHLRPDVGAREVVRIVLEAKPERDNGVFRDICVEGFEGFYTGENPPW